MKHAETTLDRIRTIVEETRCRPTVTVDVSGVAVEVADAAGCSALGCRENDGLVQVSINGFGSRTLCPEHLEELIDREVTKRRRI